MGQWDVAALGGEEEVEGVLPLENLAAEDRPGFWELNGYHNEGNPWLEERSGW